MEDFSKIFERVMKGEPKREKKIINRYMREECLIDGVAQSVLGGIEGRVSKKLYDDMMDYLLGFTKDIQLEIANNLLDAVCYGWEHYIDIAHIDVKMKSFYFLIEEEMNNRVNLPE